MSINKRLQAFKDMLDEAGLEVVEWKSTGTIVGAIAKAPGHDIHRKFGVPIKEGDWRGDKNELARMRRFYREVTGEDPPKLQAAKGVSQLGEKLKPVVEAYKFVQGISEPPKTETTEATGPSEPEVKQDEYLEGITAKLDTPTEQPAQTSQDVQAQVNALTEQRDALAQETQAWSRTNRKPKNAPKLSPEEYREMLLKNAAKARAVLRAKREALWAEGKKLSPKPHVRTNKKGLTFISGVEETPELKRQRLQRSYALKREKATHTETPEEKEQAMPTNVWTIPEIFKLTKWLDATDLTQYKSWEQLVTAAVQGTEVKRKLNIATLRSSLKAVGKEFHASEASTPKHTAEAPSWHAATVARELQRVMGELGMAPSPAFAAYMKMLEKT